MRSNTQSIVPIVVSGVSGVGKSTFGSQLAQLLDRSFVDADDFHAEAAIEKMRNSIPLSDDDRWPWLQRLSSHQTQHQNCILACSCLKKRYRDYLRSQLAPNELLFLHLDAPESIVMQRLQSRPLHFMSATLLRSQYDALETPMNEPKTYILDASLPLGMLLAHAKEIIGS
ncbi:MAG: AAA family ATPase [Gammaproteobacteria bacterium]|nr:AAA family ATPase [Gammaproteobacteria bacterium]